MDYNNYLKEKIQSALELIKFKNNLNCKTLQFINCKFTEVNTVSFRNKLISIWTDFYNDVLTTEVFFEKQNNLFIPAIAEYEKKSISLGISKRFIEIFDKKYHLNNIEIYLSSIKNKLSFTNIDDYLLHCCNQFAILMRSSGFDAGRSETTIQWEKQKKISLFSLAINILVFTLLIILACDYFQINNHKDEFEQLISKYKQDLTTISYSLEKIVTFQKIKPVLENSFINIYSENIIDIGFADTCGNAFTDKISTEKDIRNVEHRKYYIDWKKNSFDTGFYNSNILISKGDSKDIIVIAKGLKNRKGLVFFAIRVSALIDRVRRLDPKIIGLIDENKNEYLLEKTSKYKKIKFLNNLSLIQKN